MSAIDRWLKAYLHAWESDDPEDIAALFAANIRYRSAPFRKPVVGRRRVVDWWLRRGDSAVVWKNRHKVIARQGDLCVVQGTTRYPRESGDAQVFHNLWLIRLDRDGRAREFTEYWMLDNESE